MAEPVCAQKSPYSVDLEPGDYWWCACGQSANQPFCDGSHKDTGFKSHAFTAEKTGKAWLCMCKHTGNKPFCDGTHEKVCGE